MTDRILGPAYPALLAPFLPVIGRPRPGMEEQRGVVVGEPDAVTGMVLVFWPSTGTGWDVTALEPADLAIDYADPHTRDRVARALRRHVRGWAQDHDTSVRWEHYGPAWVWVLSGDDSVTHEFAEHGRAVSDRIIVPALGGVDLGRSRNDYDALALRAVAAAVWGPR